MQRGDAEIVETYSDAELQLLLRFATKGYETMLAATEELKAMVDAPNGQSRRCEVSRSIGDRERGSAPAFQRSAATNMPHIAPSIIQKCRQWSVSMMKLSPTVPRKAAKIAR